MELIRGEGIDSTRSSRPQPINRQINLVRMHADVRNRAAFAYQFLAYVERRWNTHGFHHDVEAIDLCVEDFTRDGSDFRSGLGLAVDGFAACVDRVRVWAREHAFRELESCV